MAVTVKNLLATILPATSPNASSTYTPATGKGAVVKSILFVNNTGTAVGVYAQLKKDATTTVNLCPPGMQVPANTNVTLDTEITLSYVDANGNALQIYATAGSAIDCVVSGIERDN